VKKIDQTLIDQAITLYVDGQPLDECVRQTTVSETTLRRNLAIQEIPLRNTVRFIEKICFSCGEMYMPTNARQIVCTQLACQEWRDSQGSLISVPLAEYAPHGTMVKYVSGCKCELCRGANNDKGRIDRHQMYPQDYGEILAIQSGACALCLGPQIAASGAFDVDHSHACTQHDHQRSGSANVRQSCPRCWRGLLCRVCNQQLERNVGHAYIRELEGLLSAEDARILEYVRNPPADIWRERHSISQAS